MDKLPDLFLAAGGGAGTELTELFDDFAVLEVKADDCRVRPMSLPATILHRA